MPSQGLYVAEGIAQGLNNATNNFVQLQLAKQKMSMQKESNDVDLKLKKAQIDKLELMYGPEQVQAEREKLKAETQASKALFNLRGLQISRELQNQKQSAQILNQVLKTGKVPSGFSVNSRGMWTIRGEKSDMPDWLNDEDPTQKKESGSEDVLSGLLNENKPTETKPAEQESEWWNQ